MGPRRSMMCRDRYGGKFFRECSLSSDTLILEEVEWEGQ